MAGYTVRSLIALLMLAVGLFANISCGGSHQRAEVATAATPDPSLCLIPLNVPAILTCLWNPTVVIQMARPYDSAA